MSHGNAAVALPGRLRPNDTACTPEIVLALQNEVRQLREEKEALQRRHEMGVALSAALVRWFLSDSESLVFDDGTAPVRLHSAVDEPSRFATPVSKHIAASILAAIGGGSPLLNLRFLCSGCDDAKCHGCNGHTTEITPFQIPVQVSALMAEVKRG